MRLVLLLALAAVARADFDPKLWKHRQRIEVAGPVSRVALSAATWNSAQPALADLRIVREPASEVPFVLTTATATEETRAVPVRMINRESRNRTLTVTLEFDGKQIHNRLELQTTRDNFRSRLRVEASDDGRTWAIVRAAAYVFRFQTEGDRIAEHLSMEYPDSRRRLIRLTIEDWPDTAQFNGALVWRSTANTARRSVIAEHNQPPFTTDTKRKTTCSVFHTRSMAPHDRILVRPAAEPAIFHRSVTLESSSDGRGWSGLADGALYRLGDEASNEIHFAETSMAFHRLCIFQGDDPAIRLEKILVEGIDREITFRSAEPGIYWLYTGNPTILPPAYDLARTASTLLKNPAPAALGTSEANPAFQPPPEPVKPWSDRNPALLYGGLGVAVAGLGWMALKLLRTGES